MTKRQKKTDKRTVALEVNIELVAQVQATAAAEGCVLGVIRRETVPAASALLMHVLEAAQAWGFQILVENRIDECGDVVLDVSIYADEIRVDENEIDELWPRPGQWASVERDVTDDQVDVFTDPRWSKHAARAVWVWLHNGACHRGQVADDEDWDLMWVTDFSETLLGAE